MSKTAKGRIIGRMLFLAASGYAASAWAETASVDLGITPSATANRLTMTVSASIALGTRSDTQYPTISGNLLADLDLGYDYSTYKVNSVSGLTLTGGQYNVSNTAFVLDWGFFVGKVDMAGTGLGGTFATPIPPGAVSAGQFDAAEHQAILNQGTLKATGSGLVGAMLPVNPYSVDMATDPVMVAGTGMGTVVVGDPTIVGNQATYAMTILLPASFDKVMYEQVGTAKVTAAGQGTFEAKGQFVRTLPSEWNVEGGGSWGEASNWKTGPIPDGPGAGALFGSRMAGDLPVSITLDGDRTVGTLVFDNTGQYLLSGGTAGGMLRMNGGGTGALVKVVRSSHLIDVPMELVDDVTIDVGETGDIGSLAGISSGSGRSLIKKGAGRLAVYANVHLQDSSVVDVREGIFWAQRIEAGALRVGKSASVTILPGAENPTMIKDLTLAGATDAWEATMDLTTGSLVIRADAATAGDVLRRTLNQVKTARNAAVRWTGNGITSSMAAEEPDRGLVVLLNDKGDGTRIVATLDGEALAATDIIVKYSWNGDVDLNNKIDADDYFRIDSGYLAHPASPTYREGDFNFDGKINADDYFLIDSAFLNQHKPGAAIAAVPEPGAFCGLAVLGMLGLRRRRK